MYLRGDQNDGVRFIMIISASPLGYDVLEAAVLDSYFADARIRQVPASDTLLKSFMTSQAPVFDELLDTPT